MVLILVVVAISGCVANVVNESSTNDSSNHASTGDGEITAEIVSDVPPNATVVKYSDQRVQENDYLQRAIRKAVEESGRAVIIVPENKVGKMKHDREQLPGYVPEEGSSNGYSSGYYFEYNQTVVRVEFAILD